MPTGHINMAMTLDGYVARPDHSLDWLFKQPTNAEEHGFQEFMDSIDVLVMGSGSLRTVLGFDEWPYEKPVVVLSETMTQEDIPEGLHDKIEISSLSPEALWEDFDTRGLNRVYVDGGAIIRSFLKAGFVQTIKIGLIPILIGDGIRIFGDNGRDIDLELVSSKAHSTGSVELNYKVKAA